MMHGPINIRILNLLLLLLLFLITPVKNLLLCTFFLSSNQCQQLIVGLAAHFPALRLHFLLSSYLQLNVLNYYLFVSTQGFAVGHTKQSVNCLSKKIGIYNVFVCSN